jgi:hypothetical protein
MALGQVHRCASCKHCQGMSGLCDKYKANVDGNYVCDTWEGDQQAMTFKAPPVPAAPTGLGEVKMSASTQSRDRLYLPLTVQTLSPPPLPVDLVTPQEEKATALLVHLQGLLEAERPSLTDTLFKAATRPMKVADWEVKTDLIQGGQFVDAGGMGKMGDSTPGEAGASGSRPGNSGLSSELRSPDS